VTVDTVVLVCDVVVDFVPVVELVLLRLFVVDDVVELVLVVVELVVVQVWHIGVVCPTIWLR